MSTRFGNSQKESASIDVLSFHDIPFCKLVFDEVDLGLDGGDKVEWIRLEIYIEGLERETPFMIAVYENNDEYSKLDEYKLSKGEKP